MHASARLALVFALGLSGTLRAAENLPLLRVDPALLGAGAVKAKPASPAELPAAEVTPVLKAEPTREVTTVQPVVAVPAPTESKPPAPVVQEVKPPLRPAPVADEKGELRKAPDVTVKPVTTEAPKAAAPIQPQPSAAAQTQIAQPPVVEERPAVAPLYSAHAEAGLVPALKPSGQIDPLQADKKAAYPTYIAASRLDGRNDNEVVAQGEAELRKANTTLTADRLTYWKVEDEMEAVGNVRYTKNGEFMAGPKMRLNLTDNTGYIEQPNYSVTRSAKEQKPTYSPTLGAQPVRKLPSFLPQEKKQKTATATIAGEVVDGGGNLTTASGHADLIEFQGDNRMRFTNATYSTCSAEDPDWYVKIAELNLDYDREVGGGVTPPWCSRMFPLFYTPWISFSLNNKRKSGLLTPTFGTSSKSGIEFTQPYYWDIAPNMDATISPRLMSKRGLQVNTEYRYLNHDYRGLAHVEWLPNDRLADRKRYGYSILHTHNNLGYGLSGMLNVSGVSDDRYFSDLSSRITQASQGNLLRQGVLTYGGGWWSATANVQTYQTLQDPDLPPVRQALSACAATHAECQPSGILRWNGFRLQGRVCELRPSHQGYWPPCHVLSAGVASAAVACLVYHAENRLALDALRYQSQDEHRARHRRAQPADLQCRCGRGV